MPELSPRSPADLGSPDAAYGATAPQIRSRPPTLTRRAPGRTSAGRKGTYHDAFAVCTPGLEALTAAELSAIGVVVTGRENGGVSFRATTRQLYRANIALRTVTRVLLRFASFPAESFSQLDQMAATVDWARFLPPGQGASFRVTSLSSKLFHTGAIAERLTTAVGGEGDQLVVVRLAHDRVSLSVDTSGELLHKRGWRQATAKAPLRETLAAALLMAVGWNGEVPLVDPMCGSGTIAIEAALAARGIVPGRDRRFAFQSWPSFEPGTWASVTAEAKAGERPSSVAIVAGDRDAGAITAARANAERAGVADAISFVESPLSSLPMPDGDRGWIITNPPYGARVRGGDDLRDLYAALGAVTRARPPGWRLGMLVADKALAGHSGLTLSSAFSTRNGSIPVTFLAQP